MSSDFDNQFAHVLNNKVIALMLYASAVYDELDPPAPFGQWILLESPDVVVANVPTVFDETDIEVLHRQGYFITITDEMRWLSHTLETFQVEGRFVHLHMLDVDPRQDFAWAGEMYMGPDKPTTQEPPPPPKMFDNLPMESWVRWWRGLQ